MQSCNKLRNNNAPGGRSMRWVCGELGSRRFTSSAASQPRTKWNTNCNWNSAASVGQRQANGAATVLGALSEERKEARVKGIN